MSSSYELRYESNTPKQIERLVKAGTKSFKNRLETLLGVLRDNPFGTEETTKKYRIKKLSSGEWSASPDIHHRVRYHVEGETVIIVEVAKREDAYEGI